MRATIAIIKFCSRIVGVLALITWLITVNIEIGFIKLDSAWISNNFFLTVVGGSFASMLVVLICEIQKYMNTKDQNEQSMFYLFCLLYAQLQIVNDLLRRYLEDPNKKLVEKMLEIPSTNVRQIVHSLMQLDYVTFSGNDVLYKNFQEFQFIRELQFKNLATNCGYVDIAMKKAEYKNLRCGICEIITTKNDDIRYIMITLVNSCDELSKVLEKYLKDFDKSYSWEEKKKIIFANLEMEDGYSSLVSKGKKISDN